MIVMETTAIHFQHPDRRKGRSQAAVEALHDFIGALWRNGQVLGGVGRGVIPYISKGSSQIPIARVRDGYRAFASLPAPDSLDRRYANKQVRNALTALAAVGFKVPRVERCGRDPTGGPACRCRRRRFLFLLTSFLHRDSPVHCGTCGGPIPLYKFPSTGYAGDYHDILQWQTRYQAMDWLWIGSGAGEHFAHTQMARHDSSLSKEGRDVAKTLERRAGCPVYYYLDKAVARSYRAERARRCPSCSRNWLLDEPLHKIFDFKCVKCRLLANIAWDVRPFG